jgi:hypothetical protein
VKNEASCDWTDWLKILSMSQKRVEIWKEKRTKGYKEKKKKNVGGKKSKNFK